MLNHRFFIRADSLAFALVAVAVNLLAATNGVVPIRPVDTGAALGWRTGVATASRYSFASSKLPA